MNADQKWQRLVAFLREEFPPRRPVSVALVDSSRIDGDCAWSYLMGNRFYVKIARNRWFQTRCDSLEHEWAHLLTWFGAERYEDHSPEWGVAYARIYSAVEKWDFGRK